VNSLNQLAEILQDLTGVDIAPQYTEPRPGDIRHSFADVSKAAEELQFESQISVVDGLRTTMNWYRARSAALDAK
jgi:nucleoside-diphosphate-sugar epimerase